MTVRQSCGLTAADADDSSFSGCDGWSCSLTPCAVTWSNGDTDRLIQPMTGGLRLLSHQPMSMVVETCPQKHKTVSTVRTQNKKKKEKNHYVPKVEPAGEISTADALANIDSPFEPKYTASPAVTCSPRIKSRAFCVHNGA